MERDVVGTKTQRERLIERALELHWTVLQAIQGSIVQTVCQLDITMPQLKGLLLISRDGEVTVNHVAHNLGVGQPAASSLIDRLVHEGWVSRTDDPADRRRALVRLTPAGEELVERLNQRRREFMRTVLSRVDEADLAALIQGLGALAFALKGARESAPVG